MSLDLKALEERRAVVRVETVPEKQIQQALDMAVDIEALIAALRETRGALAAFDDVTSWADFDHYWQRAKATLAKVVDG